MKKEMGKVYSVFLISVLIVSFFSFAVLAQDETVDAVDAPGGYDTPVDDYDDCGGCSGHGVCANGACMCDAGYMGEHCDVLEGNGEGGPIDDYRKDYYEKYEEYDGPKEFDVDPGMTPDSTFYFIDDFVEGVFIGDNPERALDYKEEKIAEAIVMIDKGMPAEAKEVLVKAEEYNEIIEEEVTPELEERIEESSIQIQTVLLEIEEDLAGESEWDDVLEKVDDTFEKEGKVRTASEIAAKINELCAELAQLDPIQYEDTCKTDADAPAWMRERHAEWSQEQEQEARAFGKILGECFATSGRTCRCDEISFYDFQVFCEKMSDLAVECDGGDENACVAMDSEEMPELPEHLEEVFDEIEEEFAEDKYGNEKFKPEECEGLDHKECMLIMVELKAPPECREAIKEAIGSGDIRGERGARDICDKLMFEKHTPDECIEAGARTPEACARIMMPNQCIEAGITGEHRSDEMKCKEMMKKGRHYGGGACTGEGTVEERLRCLEGAVMGMNDMYYRPEMDMPEGEMTWQCKENRIHWPPDCSIFMRDVWPEMEQQREREWDRDRMEREEYYQYKIKGEGMDWEGNILCPDGICDDWERNSGGCWADCGDTPGGGMDCGPGCYFDFYYNACECPVIMDCGPGCWPEGNTCVCSHVGGTDCGSGCWWEYDHCECAGCTCGDGRWSENCMCGITQGCWCGSWWSDTCDCGPVSGGCQCSWGWSPDCNCASGGTACSPGCWWEYDHCECGDIVACGYGCWWDDYYDSCQCSVVETCPMNSYTTSSGACDYGMCPSGCNFDYQGCPNNCMTSGGCTCSDGYYSSNCDCAGHETSGCTNYASVGQGCNPSTGTCCSSGMCSNMYGPGTCVSGGGCQCSWGWSDTCNCETTGGTCASMGGTCCTACSSAGPYISGTECNCCGGCETTTSITCYYNTWTTNAGACDYSYCPNGCTFNYQGCPDGCMTTGGYCDDGSCNVGETAASCPSDCGTTTTCPTNSYTTSAGACDYSVCANGCNFDYSGCPSGCMTTAGCYSYYDSTSCTNGGCYWCTNTGMCESSSSTCGGTDPCPSDSCPGICCDGGSYACSSDSECGLGCYCMSPGTSSSWCDCAGGGSAGCECGGSCGWSDTCDCSGCYDDTESVCEVCNEECSNSCGGYDCIGTDGDVCCYVPDCDNGMTGGVIFWDYYYG